MSEQQKIYGTVQLGVGDNVKPVSIFGCMISHGSDDSEVGIYKLEDGRVFIRITNPATGESEAKINIPLAPETFKLMVQTCNIYAVANGINICDSPIKNCEYSDNLKSAFGEK